MYGLYIDDVKGTCSPITDMMCVKYKKKFYCCFELEKAGLLQLFRIYNIKLYKLMVIKTNYANKFFIKHKKQKK
jgi:hypothetical protein